MRNWFLLIWYLVDPIYYSFTRLTYIKNDDHQNLIFRVRVTKYKGREVTLSDGTIIRKNDKLIKIHLHNAKLLKELLDVSCDISRGKYIFKKVLESLPALANYLEQHPNRDELKGIIGITTLHRGCGRLGFETYEIKNSVYRFFKLMTFSLISFLSSTSLTKQAIKKQQPKYLFMSTESLCNRYKIK
jgi:hypothetical protein